MMEYKFHELRKLLRERLRHYLIIKSITPKIMMSFYYGKTLNMGFFLISKIV